MFVEPTLDWYNQWYTGTYVYLVKKGEKVDPKTSQLVYVRMMDGALDSEHFNIHFLSAVDKWMKGYVVKYPEYELVSVSPVLGYINHKNRATFITRIPFKQWNRGFKFSCNETFSPVDEEIYLLGQRESSEKELVVDIFNKTTFSAKEALLSVASCNRLATAFNDRYCFAIKRHIKYPVIFYKKAWIGYVNDNGVACIPASVKHLTEDLSQYIECSVHE